MLKKIMFVLLFFILFFSSCYKMITRGSDPEEVNTEYLQKEGTLIFEEEKLRVEYLVTGYQEQESQEGLVFYFHGIGMTEKEWMKKDGFGQIYYDVLKSEENFYSPPVVAISLGSAFFFLEDAPYPFDTDLESLFINKIIPLFQQMLKRKGNVYLMGHSMGGYNVLTLTLRNPSRFPLSATISPYTAPISPFTKDFDKKGEELQMPGVQVAILKWTLTRAFGNEEKWLEYNPFYLVKNGADFQNIHIILSSASEDLPGFDWSIHEFSELLKDKNINHTYCQSKGTHWSVCGDVFKNFFQKLIDIEGKIQ